MEKCIENCIEWIRDEKQATLSLSQRGTISKVKRLAEQYPEDCQIVAENKDGSNINHQWADICRTLEGKEEYLNGREDLPFK